jgi:hypothetical protein
VAQPITPITTIRGSSSQRAAVVMVLIDLSSSGDHRARSAWR